MYHHTYSPLSIVPILKPLQLCSQSYIHLFITSILSCVPHIPTNIKGPHHRFYFTWVYCH